jgi:hypothetical protein
MPNVAILLHIPHQDDHRHDGAKHRRQGMPGIGSAAMLLPYHGGHYHRGGLPQTVNAPPPGSPQALVHVRPAPECIADIGRRSEPMISVRSPDPAIQSPGCSTRRCNRRAARHKARSKRAQMWRLDCIVVRSARPAESRAAGPAMQSPGCASRSPLKAGSHVAPRLHRREARSPRRATRSRPGDAIAGLRITKPAEAGSDVAPRLHRRDAGSPRRATRSRPGDAIAGLRITKPAQIGLRCGAAIASS